MINIYQIQSSGSTTLSDFTVINTNATNVGISQSTFNNTTVNPYVTQYTYSTLEITASSYGTNGPYTPSSTINNLRVYIKSGSNVLFTSPLDSVIIFYSQSYYSPSVPNFPTSSAFGLNYIFSPNIPSSSYDILKITGSSINILISESFQSGYTTASLGDNIKVILSGSGIFYTSSIIITDTQTGDILSYVTSSNNYLTTSFYIPVSSSYDKTYKIEADTKSIPYIALSYTSLPFPADSLSEYNFQYQVSASSISSSGNTVYLIGGNLSTITSFGSEASLNMSNFSSYGLNSLNTLDLSYEALKSYINISNLPSLANLNLGGNYLTSSRSNYTSSQYLQSITLNACNMSGSIQNILNSVSTSSLTLLDINSNNLTGSTPSLSQSLSLNQLICSFNKLSGSITDLANNGLTTFDCRNNYLTGSIPSFISCSSLYYFDCSYNQLSGSIPNLDNSTPLVYLKCSNNYLTGSIPSFISCSNLHEFYGNNNQLSGSINLTGLPNLITFNVNYNQLSGSIVSLNGCTSLSDFECGYNNLTGSIPDLSSNTSLTTFDAGHNRLSGSIPDLSNNVNLDYFGIQNNFIKDSIPDLKYNTLLNWFRADYNELTGDIPDLSYNTVLANFTVSNNQLTGYTGGGTISSLLENFDASNNSLSYKAVDDILVDINNGGSLLGNYINLSGGSNSAPSAVGLAVTESLQAKGWTIYIN